MKTLGRWNDSEKLVLGSGNGMGKFREMGERVYEMREVTESITIMGVGIGNFIIG